MQHLTRLYNEANGNASLVFLEQEFVDTERLHLCSQNEKKFECDLLSL